MDNIKQVKLYDENSNEIIKSISIIPKPEDIIFDDGKRLSEKVDEINKNLQSKSESNHKHNKADINDFPTKLSQFNNDEKFVKQGELENFHTHKNLDLLETLTKDLFVNLADKFTKEEVITKLQDTIMSIKNICAQKAHNHNMSDILDYVPPTVPTRMSQLTNDKNYITKDYLINWAPNPSGPDNHSNLNVLNLLTMEMIQNFHSHDNKTVLDTITSDMIRTFNDKYTKNEIDKLIKDIKDSIASSGVGDDILNLINSKASAQHTHEISDINGVDGHTHKNKNALDLITNDLLTNLQNKYTKQEINKLIDNINIYKADVEHLHNLADIQDIYNIIEIVGTWTLVDFTPENTDSTDLSNIFKPGCISIYDANYCYIIGGTNNASILLYNIEGNNFEDSYMIPGYSETDSLLNISACNYLDDIYIIDPIKFKIHIFNKSTKKFNSIEYPQAKYNSSCIISDDFLYIIGGSTAVNDGYIKTIDIMDIENKEFTIDKYQLEGNIGKATAIKINKKIYVLGGSSSNTEYNTFMYIFNPIKNTWSRVNLNSIIYNNPFLYTIFGSIYIMGGTLLTNNTISNSKKSFKLNTQDNKIVLMTDNTIEYNHNAIAYHFDNQIVLLSNSKKNVYTMRYEPKGNTNINENLNNKMELVVTDNLPDIRNNTTIYFKVTNTEVVSNILVSPNMALRIE